MCTTTKIGATFGLNEDKIDNNAEVPPVDAPIAITSQERVLLGFVFDGPVGLSACSSRLDRRRGVFNFNNSSAHQTQGIRLVELCTLI
ncbi:MAG: hypothetical protein VW297_12045 [Paracoccaceae bacterium]